MTPQTNSPEFPNPNYWTQMAAWLAAVVAAVHLKYGIFLIVLRTSEPLAFTDTLSGLSSIDMFQVYWLQQQFLWPVVAAQYAAFMHDPDGFADALVTQMANGKGLNRPDPLPPPAPPQWVPPSNPIGEAFTSVTGEDDFTDLGSPSIPIGGTYITTEGVKYLKRGRRTPFAIQTWWTKGL